jgi:hypothetical protein
MNKILGKCLCEKVQYEIAGQLGPIFNCHCSKCRRWHGAAFRTRASIDKSQLIWLSGKDNVSAFRSSDDVTKYFCTTCGSPLHSTYEDRPNVVGIPLGGLEGLGNVQAQAHIFTANKASWYQINDDLPQFEQWPESESVVRQTNN